MKERSTLSCTVHQEGKWVKAERTTEMAHRASPNLVLHPKPQRSKQTRQICRPWWMCRKQNRALSFVLLVCLCDSN